MNDSLQIFGLEPQHLAGWTQGARVTIHAAQDNDRVSGWEFSSFGVIDAASGPLDLKQKRLQALVSAGVGLVVSASTTATVAAQTAWVSGRMRIVGCDPLLMAAGAKTQTLVGATQADVEWLSRVWPDRRFVVTEDAIGLVFSREILPMINEAADFVSRGLNPLDIDSGVRLGLNYPRGPMQWATLFGWSAVFWGLRALEDMYGPRFRPHPWIRAQIGSSLADISS